MSPAKNVATVGMIWAALGSTVRAEPVSTSGGAWTYFFGRSNPGNVFGAYNGGFTPAAPATSISTTASAMTARIVPRLWPSPFPRPCPCPPPYRP